MVFHQVKPARSSSLRPTISRQPGRGRQDISGVIKDDKETTGKDRKTIGNHIFRWRFERKIL
jgi:hypothetical protein